MIAKEFTAELLQMPPDCEFIHKEEWPQRAVEASNHCATYSGEVVAAAFHCGFVSVR
jgi:hypothetical protein